MLSATRPNTKPCEDRTSTINDVESLKKGIIKTSRNEANKPYTILLIGETGTGKSSISELIANVLAGNDIDHYDFDILNNSNEQRGSVRSQTNETRLYEFTSNSGVVVRILDTPGLKETRDIQQDENHRKKIATQVKEYTDSVTAVLVLANGTVARDTGGPIYALSTLSAIFPNTPTNNIGFMLTNVALPFSSNFSKNNLPDVLKDARQFEIDNPVALQQKYLKFKDDQARKHMSEMHRRVKASEQAGLEELVNLFDWLDGLEPLPTMKSTHRCKKPQNLKSTNGLVRRMKGLLRKVKTVFEGVRAVKRTPTVG